MAPRVAKRPFTFTGCVELRQTLDVHALDERATRSGISSATGR